MRSGSMVSPRRLAGATHGSLYPCVRRPVHPREHRSLAPVWPLLWLSGAMKQRKASILEEATYAEKPTQGKRNQVLSRKDLTMPPPGDSPCAAGCAQDRLSCLPRIQATRKWTTRTVGHSTSISECHP